MTGAEFATSIVYPVVAIIIATSVVALVARGRKLLGLIYEIKAEVLPNGGGSMRDVVNRVEARQVAADAQFSEHLSQGVKRRKKFDKMYKEWREAQSALIAAT